VSKLLTYYTAYKLYKLEIVIMIHQPCVSVAAKHTGTAQAAKTKKRLQSCILYVSSEPMRMRTETEVASLAYSPILSSALILLQLYSYVGRPYLAYCKRAIE